MILNTVLSKVVSYDIVSLEDPRTPCITIYLIAPLLSLRTVFSCYRNEEYWFFVILLNIQWYFYIPIVELLVFVRDEKEIRLIQKFDSCYFQTFKCMVFYGRKLALSCKGVIQLGLVWFHEKWEPNKIKSNKNSKQTKLNKFPSVRFSFKFYSFNLYILLSLYVCNNYMQNVSLFVISRLE